MTAGSDLRPLRRKLTSRTGQTYKLEVLAAELVLRPFGTRAEPLVVRLDVGTLYVRALLAQSQADKRAKRRVKR